MKDHRTIQALLAVFLIFMELLDTTVINTSLPSIAKSMQVSPLNLREAIASYLIMIAIFTPLSSYIADRIGIKVTLIIAIVGFTLSSLLCGLSHNEIDLAIYRGLQGASAAMMTPVARLLIYKIYNSQELIFVTSYLTIPLLFGPILGPLVGGYISTFYNWHWIFFINIPLGGLALFGVYQFIPQLKVINKTKFSWFGFLLIGSGFALINFALESMNDVTLNQRLINLFFILGTLALICYILFYKRFSYKIIRLDLLKNQSFRIGILQSIITMCACGGLGFLLPVLLQKQFKLDPWHSGLITFAMAVGGLCMKPLQTRVYRIVRQQRLIVITPLLLGLTLGLFATINNSLNLPSLFAVEFIFGMLYSLQLNLNTTAALFDLPAHEKSYASSFQSTIMLFGMSLSIGLSGLIYLYCTIAQKASHVTGAALVGFQHCVIILGIISASAAVLTFLDLKLCKNPPIIP